MLTDAEVAAIIARSNDNCDVAAALRKVLRLLVEANLQEADEGDSDEEYATKTQAETSLFLLATAQTNGHRGL